MTLTPEKRKAAALLEAMDSNLTEHGNFWTLEPVPAGTSSLSGGPLQTPDWAERSAAETELGPKIQVQTEMLQHLLKGILQRLEALEQNFKESSGDMRHCLGGILKKESMIEYRLMINNLDSQELRRMRGQVEAKLQEKVLRIKQRRQKDLEGLAKLHATLQDGMAGFEDSQLSKVLSQAPEVLFVLYKELKN